MNQYKLSEYDRLAYARSFLTKEQSLLAQHIKVEEIKIDYHSTDGHKDIVNECMRTLLKDFKVYWVFSEKNPQKKSKVRSFRKIFYEDKKHIEKNRLFESEIDVKADQSILASIISLSNRNIDYCTNNLINSNLFLGFAVQKDKRAYQENRQSFLNGFIGNNNVYIHAHIHAAIISNLSKNRFFFSITNDGQDALVLQFFLKNECTLPNLALSIPKFG